MSMMFPILRAPYVECLALAIKQHVCPYILAHCRLASPSKLLYSKRTESDDCERSASTIGAISESAHDWLVYREMKDWSEAVVVKLPSLMMSTQQLAVQRAASSHAAGFASAALVYNPTTTPLSCTFHRATTSWY
jgi:hypothetical protein